MGTLAPRPPPGFETSQPQHESSGPPVASESQQRDAPTIPPGFTPPSTAALADAQSTQRPLKSRTASNAITPAVPVIPATPGRIGTPLKKELKRDYFDEEKENSSPIAETTTFQEESKRTVKASVAATTKISGSPVGEAKATIAVPKTRNSVKTVTPSEELPTVGANETAEVLKHPSRTSTLPQKDPAPAGKPATSTDSTKSITQIVSGSTKRRPPGKLDIAAATKVPERSIETATSASSRIDTAKTSQPPTASTLTHSRPATPGATSTGSPIRRTTQPRTLRVVPKTETPPPPSASSAGPSAISGTRGPSRKASITSINVPGTPSELVSDNVSVTSASASLTMSRASSPPLVGGKVGTAPIKKSKSQAARERKEKAAAKLAAQEEALTQKEEPMQAPILGRKKKEKKREKVSSVPSSAKAKTPVASHPSSPAPADAKEEPVEAKERPDELVSSPVSLPVEKESGPTAEASSTQNKPAERKSLTPSSIFKDLSVRGEFDAATLEFFKTSISNISSQIRHDPTMAFNNWDVSNAFPLDPLDQPSGLEDQLERHEPIQWQDGADPSRLSARNLVGRSGAWLRMLKPEEEQRYIELEKRILDKAQAGDPGRWIPNPRKTSTQQMINDNSSLPNVHRYYESIFHSDHYARDFHAQHPQSLLAAGDDRAGSILPGSPAMGASAPSKAASADEALAYVNQFVLPTVPLPHPQTGKPADAIYLGPSSDHNGTGANAPGFAIDGNSYRFVGVGGEPALVGSVGPTANAATLSATAHQSGAAGFGGPHGGPGTVDAWAAMERITATRRGGRTSAECPVPELGWSGPTFASVAEAERAVAESKKDTEKYEKQLSALVKKNRRLVGLGGGSGVAAAH